MFSLDEMNNIVYLLHRVDVRDIAEDSRDLLLLLQEILNIFACKESDKT